MKKKIQNKKWSPIALGSTLILLCVLFLTVGYSDYFTELNIDGIAAIVRIQRDIRISDISVSGSSSDAITHWEDYNISTISGGISLPNADSTVTYNVQVTNVGNMEAAISEISGLPSNLKYTLNNYNLNDMMCDDNDSTSCKLGSTKTISITIGYAPNGYNSGSIDYTIALDFEFSYMVDSVAMIGNKFYDTLQLAVNDVPTTGDLTTIKLLNNTSEIITIAQGKNIALDLNNKTLSNNGKSPVISNYGTLEIMNGIITSNTTQGAINNESTGNLTISSGRIIATGTRQALYNNKGTATITGTAYLSATSSERATVQNLSGGTLNILGGQIVSTRMHGVVNAGSMAVGVKDGNIDVTSPSIQGAQNGINSTTNYSFYNGVAKGKIRGINVDSRVTDTETGYSIAYVTDNSGGETFETAILAASTNLITFNPNGGTITDRTRYIPTGGEVGTLPVVSRSGYELLGWFTSNNEGDQISSSTIINSPATFYAQWVRVGEVAQIGDTIYASIQEAVNSAPNNTQTTVKLLKNFSEAFTVPASKNIILDLNGYTLSNTGDSSIVENSGILSVTNGTIASNAATKAAINQNKGSFTINDGQILATGDRQAIYILDGTVEIGGTAYLTSRTSGTPTTTTMPRGTVQILAGSVTITGGTIVGVEQQAISNEGSLTIGVKDGSIDATSPVLIGKVQGLKTTGSLYFYDGIVKGKTTTIDGTITEQEDNSQVVNGTETIDGATYITSYLESTE